MASLQKFWRSVGPGVITGASDDDPSGIVTYSQAGAKFGFQMLWLAPLTTPLAMAAQEMSARLGIVTRRGLGSLLRRYVSPRVAVVISLLLLTVNAINIGADLGAMAAVAKLIAPAPTLLYLAMFAGLIISLEVLIPYRRYVNVLKWLTLALMSYVAAAFFTHPDWTAVVRGTLTPHLQFNAETVSMIVAVLGTTISPYLFFWQSSEEVEEEGRLPRSAAHVTPHLRRMRLDTVFGMTLSNLIMFFIIVTVGSTLHQAGITTITNAQQAAEALRPIAGQLTFVLFSLGVIGTGLLAVPVLGGAAAYALSEVSGWKEGLSNHYKQAPSFYAVIIAAIWIGTGFAASGISPITFLITAAILNGLLAPIVLWYILRLADRADVVGNFRTRPVVRIAGWVTWALMSVAAVVFVIQLIWQSA